MPSIIELIVPPRAITLVGDLHVNRILPYRAKRMVGPFVFLDHMGPLDLHPGNSGDIAPHPHIGLSTVTYLFEGGLIHRDTLGTVQEIRPGDVNWMTAGKGIAHSERIPLALRNQNARLHGIQIWVALPIEAEEAEPSFRHYGKETLPQFEIEGVEYSLIAGEILGHKSPVQTHSRLFYLSTKIPEQRSIQMKMDQQESAFYLVEGEVEIEGQKFTGPNLIVFRPNAAIQFTATTNSVGILIGGDPLPEPRYIWWNFVSSSKERIEAAKQIWRDQKFPEKRWKVPDETDYIPLPEK